MEELLGDVGEDGSAARRNAALSDKNEKAREEPAKVHTWGTLGEFGEEVRREVDRVIVQWSEGKTGGDLTIIVPQAKAEHGGETGKGAAPAIGIAEVAARRIAERPLRAALFRSRGGSRAGLDAGCRSGGCRCFWVQSVNRHSVLKFSWSVFFARGTHPPATMQKREKKEVAGRASWKWLKRKGKQRARAVASGILFG
jgi:hypothetical protein